MSDTNGTRVPRRYKVAVAILAMALVIVSLLWFQQVSLLQLRNNQLSSQTSSLGSNVSDLNKIVKLEKIDVLVTNAVVNWTPGMGEVSLKWSCDCFQYSGYLRVNWTSPASLSFRFVQFGLNLTTPVRTGFGDFRVPLTGGQPFVAAFIVPGCPGLDSCTATYSAVYHY